MKEKLDTNSPFFDVVADAYRVFRTPKPVSLGVCQNCCMHPEIEKDFLNVPIEELPVSYVQNWFNGATDEILPHGIWAYLLPRILEVLALGELPSPVGVEVSLNRYPTGDRNRWNTTQWDVLDRFQRKYIEQCSFPEGVMLDDVICMFVEATFPIDNLLKQLDSLPDEVLVNRLWADWCEWTISNEIWLTTFWTGDNVGKTKAWYSSKGLYRRLQAFGISGTTPPQMSKKALQVAEVVLAAV